MLKVNQNSPNMQPSGTLLSIPGALAQRRHTFVSKFRPGAHDHRLTLPGLSTVAIAGLCRDSIAAVVAAYRERFTAKHK